MDKELEVICLEDDDDDELKNNANVVLISSDEEYNCQENKGSNSSKQPVKEVKNKFSSPNKETKIKCGNSNVTQVSRNEGGNIKENFSSLECHREISTLQLTFADKSPEKISYQETAALIKQPNGPRLSFQSCNALSRINSPTVGLSGKSDLSKNVTTECVTSYKPGILGHLLTRQNISIKYTSSRGTNTSNDISSRIQSGSMLPINFQLPTGVSQVVNVLPTSVPQLSVANVQQPLLASSLLQNSVAVNIQNSVIPPLPSRPLAINVQLPNTRELRPALVQVPVTINTTPSRIQMPTPSYCPSLVILQSAPNPTFGNLSVKTPTNNFQIAPQFNLQTERVNETNRSVITSSNNFVLPFQSEIRTSQNLTHKIVTMPPKADSSTRFVNQNMTMSLENRGSSNLINKQISVIQSTPINLPSNSTVFNPSCLNDFNSNTNILQNNLICPVQQRDLIVKPQNNVNCELRVGDTASKGIEMVQSCRTENLQLPSSSGTTTGNGRCTQTESSVNNSSPSFSNSHSNWQVGDSTNTNLKGNHTNPSLMPHEPNASLMKNNTDPSLKKNNTDPSLKEKNIQVTDIIVLDESSNEDQPTSYKTTARSDPVTITSSIKSAEVTNDQSDNVTFGIDSVFHISDADPSTIVNFESSDEECIETCEESNKNPFAIDIIKQELSPLKSQVNNQQSRTDKSDISDTVNCNEIKEEKLCLDYDEILKEVKNEGNVDVKVEIKKEVKIELLDNVVKCEFPFVKFEGKYSDHEDVEDHETRENEDVEDHETRENEDVEDHETRENELVEDHETRENELVEDHESCGEEVVEDLENFENELQNDCVKAKQDSLDACVTQETGLCSDVKPFICPHCGFGVAIERNLEMHIKAFHTGKNVKSVPSVDQMKKLSEKTSALVVESMILKCFECGYRTHRLTNFSKHLMVEHNLFSCNKCCFIVDNPVVLRDHEAVHKKVRCNICCDSVFSSQLQHHVYTEHADMFKFKCDQCDQRFRSDVKLNNHMHIHKDKKENEKEGVFSCGICSFATGDQSALSTHEESHTARCRFLCLLCGFRASTEASLATHQQQNHLQSEKLCCSYCSFSAKSKSELMSHKYQIHSEKYLFECGECSYKALSVYYLKDHLKNAHFKKSTGQLLPVKCKLCEFRASDNGGIREHCLTAHKDKYKYFCDHCAFFGYRKVRLIDHMQTHFNSKTESEVKLCSKSELFKFKCGFCIYESNDKEDYSQHRYVSHADKLPFSCRLCKYRVDSGTKLERHETSVHNYYRKHYRLYKCPMCDFKTSDNTLLNKHRYQIHIKEYPLKCSQCMYRTSKTCDFLKHCRNVHRKKLKGTVKNENIGTMHERNVLNSAQENVSDMYLYHCTMCSFTAESLRSFESHKSAAHKLLCDLCSYTASSLDNLYSHLIESHPNIYKFKCKYCSYCTSNKPFLKNHEIITHKPMPCHYCKFKGNTNSGMKHHIRDNHPEKYPFECDVCAYQTMNQTYLKLHREKLHLRTFELKSEKDAVDKCKEDNSEFQSNKSSFNTGNANLIENNMQKSHKSICSDCKFVADSVEDLSCHLFQNHHSKYPLFCLFCSHVADSHNLLITHEESEHDTRLYRCSTCPYFTGSFYLLCTHISESHMTNIALSLPAEYKGLLKKSNTGGGRKCQLCQFSTKKWQELYKHRSSSHPEEYVWKCPKCLYVSLRQGALLKHDKKNHSKITVHCCQYCSFRTDKRSKIIRHQNSKHPNKLSFLCTHCPFRGSCSRYLQDHMLQVHNKSLAKENSSAADDQIAVEEACSDSDLKPAIKSDIKRSNDVLSLEFNPTSKRRKTLKGSDLQPSCSPTNFLNQEFNSNLCLDKSVNISDYPKHSRTDIYNKVNEPTRSVASGRSGNTNTIPSTKQCTLDKWLA